LTAPVDALAPFTGIQRLRLKPEEPPALAKKILIAEDSLTMRSLIVSTIAAMGDYQTVEAANGFEALRLLPREKVDLIITDINMPDINGLELVSFIRSNDNYRDTPLLIISTEGSERDREKGMALGANAYLVKPFAPDQLQQLIREYLD
jgi:two-component system chemotaxis response regulator CheY